METSNFAGKCADRTHLILGTHALADALIGEEGRRLRS